VALSTPIVSGFITDVSFIFFKPDLEVALEIIGYLIALLKRKVSELITC
jgi:hypothetical protein